MVVVLAVLVGAAVAGGVGWSWARGDGVLRRGSGERIRPADVALTADDYGLLATLLLFTSPDDVRTPPVRAALRELARRNAGVRVAEVDLRARGDLAGRYAVTRTPTVFVLDGQERLRARVAGGAEPGALADALAAALPRAG